MAMSSKPPPQDRRFGPSAGVADTSKSRLAKLSAGLLAGGAFAGFWAATEIFAWRSEFSPLLGANIAHIYEPWKIVPWAVQYGADHKRSLNLAFISGVFAGSAPLLALGLNRMNARNKMQINPDLHGSARWAGLEDLKKNQLLGEHGVVIGGFYDEKTRTTHVLRHNGPHHVLCVAPTRSGKGLGLVIPTLLSWHESVVIADLKGELYALTSGWRGWRNDNDIVVFEAAANGGTSRWNMVEEIRVGTPYEVADAQNLALMIVDPEGKGLDDHWTKTSYDLIGGAILHLIYRAGHQYQVPRLKSDGTLVLKMDANGQLIPKRQRDEGGNLIPVYTETGAEQAEEFVTGARFQLLYEGRRLSGVEMHQTDRHGAPVYALGDDGKPLPMRDAKGEVLIDRVVGPTLIRFHERDGRKTYVPYDLEGRPIPHLCRPGTAVLESDQDFRLDKTVYQLRSGPDGQALLDAHGNVQCQCDEHPGPGYGYPLFKPEYYQSYEEADGRREIVRDAETGEPILADGFKPFAPLEPITRPKFRTLTDRQGNDLYETETETRTAGLGNMAGLGTLLADPERPNLQDLWQEMMTFDHYGPEHPLYGRGVGPNRCTNPAIAQSAKDMFDRPEEEGGSVLSTAKTNLNLYRDPIVAANTAQSDFKITDLMRSKKPISLYIITQPADKDRLRPLIRILFTMMTRALMPTQEFWEGRPTAEYRHELLFMIDEFPSLGKMPMIESTLAFAAGYGLKYYLITQDLNQLRDKEAYGPQEKITAHCQVQTAYAPNLRETAEYLSTLCGETTYIEQRISRTSGGGLSSTRQKTRTYSLEATGRPLLKPDEVIALDQGKRSPDGKLILEGGKMLIKPAAGPMIMGKQLIYAQHPLYGPRSKVPRMPVYPLVRVRYYSVNPRYKAGAIAEDGIFLRYDEEGRIIKSVGWDMAPTPPKLTVETIQDSELGQLGLETHEIARLAFRRHTFNESVVRPMLRFDDPAMDAAEAARLVVADKELRAREPRVTVTRTILLVYQDGQLLNSHHLPPGVEAPPAPAEPEAEPAQPRAASQAFMSAWDTEKDGVTAIAE